MCIVEWTRIDWRCSLLQLIEIEDFKNWTFGRLIRRKKWLWRNHYNRSWFVPFQCQVCSRISLCLLRRAYIKSRVGNHQDYYDKWTEGRSNYVKWRLNPWNYFGFFEITRWLFASMYFREIFWWKVECSEAIRIRCWKNFPWVRTFN